MQRKITWQLLLAALVSTLLLGGCTRTYTWKEEVTLKSGEKLLVQRSQKYNSSGGEWDPGIDLWYNLVQAKIRIDGVPVEWVGPPAVYPMIVERWEGKYVVVYISGTCGSFFPSDRRRYVHPYHVNAFIEGAWREVDVFDVREVFPRNLVAEWREGGFLAGDQKYRKMKSERAPGVKEAEIFDISLPSGCVQKPSLKASSGE